MMSLVGSSSSFVGSTQNEDDNEPRMSLTRHLFLLSARTKKFNDESTFVVIFSMCTKKTMANVAFLLSSRINEYKKTMMSMGLVAPTHCWGHLQLMEKTHKKWQLIEGSSLSSSANKKGKRWWQVSNFSSLFAPNGINTIWWWWVLHLVIVFYN
jgi:hypothetical protein